MNHFNLMLQKRLKHDEEEIEDDEKGKQRTKTKDFKTGNIYFIGIFDKTNIILYHIIITEQIFSFFIGFMHFN